MFPWQPGVLTLGSAHRPERQHEGPAPQLVHLIPALGECAGHVAAGRLDDANRCFEVILGLASVGDGPAQRLARILVDCLVRRSLGSTSRALIDPTSYLNQTALRAARNGFIKLLPFLKVAYVAINRVILEAMENEQFVHIIDLSGPAADSWQWLKLMHDFRRRPEGPPADLRITVVHDDGAFLADTSALLRREAEALDMAFTFHGVLGRLETVDLGNLHQILAIKSGYARAFSCALQMRRLLRLEVDDAGTLQQQQAASMAHEMHNMNPHATSPAPSLSSLTTTPSPQQRLVPPPLTQLLLAVRALSPKVLAFMEQEADHNVPDFAARFTAALHYYAALFDALHNDTGGGLQQEERAQVEQVVLGEEIKDVLVRDAVAEPMQRWRARMANAGFGRVPLSYVAKMEADHVLRKCRVRGLYENRAHDNCLLLYRGDRSLYSVSAWRPWTQVAAFGGSQRQHVAVPPPEQAPPTWTWPQLQAPPVHNFT